MKYKIFLVLITLLAIGLRFYKLDSLPALNADEAAIGYNAYSLLETGKDEHGNIYPIHFQSFNDYKPGLFFYLVLPFVKTLGLNEWAVRIPGASLGVISGILIYFLVKQLFKNEKFALISSFFLAISPWHIHFSRGGWEVNAATCFILFGILFFMKFIEKNRLLTFIASLFFFVLSLYTYHAARVIVPLIGLSLALIYRRETFIKENVKGIILGSAISLILLFPLAKDLLGSNTLSRVSGVGLFADLGPVNRVNEQRGEHGINRNIVGIALHNKVINYGLAFIGNWASHFNGEFLFMSGDSIERNKVPETGEMYLFDIVFLFFGFVFLSKKFDKNWKFLVSWLIFAPIASALTFQSPNALRAQNMVIPLTIISAYGFSGLIDWGRNHFKKYLAYSFYFLLFGVVFWNFGRYLNMYYLHMSKVFPYSSQYGVEEMVSFVNQNKDKFNDVFITGRYDQPYILYLFYSRYSPSRFQSNHTLTSRDDYGFSTVSDFDKLHFGSIDFSSIKNNYPNSLIIGTPDEVPNSSNIVKRIYGTNGYEYFDAVEN